MFFLSKKFSKYFLVFSFVCIFINPEILKSESIDIRNKEKKEINSNYLNPNKELEDYIIDKGDNLYINFFPAIDLSGFYAVNDEGEIFLPRLNEINVPTLVIHGTEDAILPLDHGIALADGIKNSTRMIMDKVGHEIPEQLYSEIVNAIVENIKRAY